MRRSSSPQDASRQSGNAFSSPSTRATDAGRGAGTFIFRCEVKSNPACRAPFDGHSPGNCRRLFAGCWVPFRRLFASAARSSELRQQRRNIRNADTHGPQPCPCHAGWLSTASRRPASAVRACSGSNSGPCGRQGGAATEGCRRASPAAATEPFRAVDPRPAPCAGRTAATRCLPW